MKITEIRCDDCDLFGDSHQRKPAHLLRAGLYLMGWVVGQPGGTDFCPVCKVKRAAKKGAAK